MILQCLSQPLIADFFPLVTEVVSPKILDLLPHMTKIVALCRIAVVDAKAKNAKVGPFILFEFKSLATHCCVLAHHLQLLGHLGMLLLQGALRRLQASW